MKIESDQPRTAVNVSIFFAAATAFLTGLWFASHSPNIWIQIFGIAIVAHAGNTLFALLHESVHKIFSNSKAVNEFFGTLSAAFFPTGLTFQRICHLSHHLRNRTDHEMFDMYYPGDSKFLKFSQFYAILTGIYWITIPLGWLTYLVWPGFYKVFKFQNADLQHTGAIMLQSFINHPKVHRIRLELLFTIFLQVAIFYVLNLSILPTFIAYYVFGLYWGSLQYADHAWSERNIQSGAWNLKVNPFTRIVFLNYHLHQVHHIHPKMPWHKLPLHVDSASYQPRFLTIYLQMWRGPRPIEKGQTVPLPAKLQQELEFELQDEDINVYA